MRTIDDIKADIANNGQRGEELRKELDAAQKADAYSTPEKFGAWMYGQSSNWTDWATGEAAAFLAYHRNAWDSEESRLYLSLRAALEAAGVTVEQGGEGEGQWWTITLPAPKPQPAAQGMPFDLDAACRDIYHKWCRQHEPLNYCEFVADAIRPHLAGMLWIGKRVTAEGFYGDARCFHTGEISGVMVREGSSDFMCKNPRPADAKGGQQ